MRPSSSLVYGEEAIRGGLLSYILTTQPAGHIVRGSFGLDAS